MHDFFSWMLKVICRQLGMFGGVAHSKSFYGQGSGQIWLKDIACAGSEPSLDKCDGGDKLTSQINSCFHYEDASVTCTGKEPCLWTLLYIRPLYSPADPLMEMTIVSVLPFPFIYHSLFTRKILLTLQSHLQRQYA